MSLVWSDAFLNETDVLTRMKGERTDDFEALGLSAYEARVLDAVLAGPVTLRDLAYRARVPPGKISTVVRRLRDRGLVERTDDRPMRIHVPNASAAVSRLVSEREEALFSSISRLRDSAASLDRSRAEPSAFFEIGSTREDNERIQLRVFEEARREVLQVLNVHHAPSSNRSSKRRWEEAIEAAAARGVRFRAIYPRAAKLPPIIERLAATDSFAIRRLDTDFTRCDVVDGRAVMVKLVGPDKSAFGGIVFFEDRRFAGNLGRVFETLWSEAAPSDHRNP